MSKEPSIERSAPLYQQAYTVLKRKILEGHYRPGEALTESFLAQELGVSRTPVREALRQLEKDGLVQTHRYEVTISKPSRDEFVELYLCRAALEQLVAERAALKASPDDVQAMAYALNDASEALARGDQSEVLQSNTRFHDRMVASARVSRLSELMHSIRGPILLARRVVLASGEVFERHILAEHQELLLGIERHDPEHTKTWMRTHMDNDIERGLAQFDAYQTR